MSVRQTVQGLQPFRDDVLMRRELVVGQGLPVRKVNDREIIVAVEKKTELGPDTVCRRCVRHDHHCEPVVGAGRLGHREAACAAVQAAPSKSQSRSVGTWGIQGADSVWVDHRLTGGEWRGGHSPDAPSMAQGRSGGLLKTLRIDGYTRYLDRF